MARFKTKPVPISRRKKSKSTPPQPRKNLAALYSNKEREWEYMNSPRERLKLKIGVVKFPAINQPTESLPVSALINNPFAPTADEVFTSLDYLLKLLLFHPKEATKAADSLMR